jgi:hypothetical protein
VHFLRPSLPLVALLGAACAVDSGTAPSYDGAPAPDGAPPAEGAPPPVDATPVCEDITLNVAETGHHVATYDFDNGGLGCLGGSCHNGSGLGETYTAAGSVWNRRIAGGDPVAGAYVYVIDANGKVVRMITAQNGFFWTDEELAAPIRTYASGCPESNAMEANTTGNCNANGTCHTEGNKIFVRPVPL